MIGKSFLLIFLTAGCANFRTFVSMQFSLLWLHSSYCMRNMYTLSWYNDVSKCTLTGADLISLYAFRDVMFNEITSEEIDSNLPLCSTLVALLRLRENVIETIAIESIPSKLDFHQAHSAFIIHMLHGGKHHSLK